jgi:hypothetical protein
MPPPRRRRRVQLSAYDRELLQAVNDRRLDRDDPEVQAVLQRLEQAPGLEPWQTDDVRVQPEAPPPPSSFEADVALTRAGQAGRESIADQMPRRAFRENPNPVSQPESYGFSDMGMDVANAAVRGLGAEVSVNPQDWLDTPDRYRQPDRGPIGTPRPDEGRPTIGPTTTAGQALTAFGAVLPWAYSKGSDLLTGQDHATPAPNIFAEGEQPTFRSVFTEHGYPDSMGTIGSMLDWTVDPSNFIPYVGTAAKVLGTAVAALPPPKALRALQDVLPAKNWNFFRRGVENTPGATRPLSMLLPSEIEPLTRSAGGVQRFVDTYNQLPDADYLAAAIRRGAPKRGWYANSRQALTDIFGDDADMFTGVLASMSPQTSVESNLTNALNTFVNWRAAGRPTTEQAIKDIMARSVQGGTEKSVLTAWTPNTVRVLQGGQSISGPKIDQFWLALRERALETRVGSMDPNEAMVLDAWMGNLMGADQKLWGGSLTKANAPARLATGDAGATASYLAGVARMREAAKKVGVEGAEAQEMAWSTAMALYERASLEGISAREVLRRGLLTDEVVAGTPDFATLLRDPEFSSILSRDTDLSSRVASLTPTPRAATDAITMSDTDQRHLLRVADTLDELRAMRLTDTAVQTGRMSEDTLAGVVPAEAVTDDQYSALLGYGATPEGTRIHRSPRIFGAGETLREQQGVLEAALGPGTGSRSRGRGSYVADTGQSQIDKLREQIDTLRPGDERQDLEQLLAQLKAVQLQENPVSSYGFTGRAVRGGGLPVEMERRLRAARDILAGGTGQSYGAHVVINPGVSRARHNAATIYAGRDLERSAISAFAADLRALNVAGSFAPVHSGRSVRVLRLDEDFVPTPLSKSEEASVRQLAARHFGTENAKGQMSAPRMVTGENVAKKGYEAIAQGAEAGSGIRVGRMVGKESDWAQLSAAVQRRMDTAVKAWATRLLNIYDMPRILRERPDEARMLEILASTGASGLATAREAGVVLPALAALGFRFAPSREPGSVPQREEA